MVVNCLTVVPELSYVIFICRPYFFVYPFIHSLTHPSIHLLLPPHVCYLLESADKK